ncbi:hypothetical protein PPTG_23085 [Phytophthora nicotianae INRA-310]|uniref:Uncharacterized protein n=1 Tax=Phytophthora nicotianae (strain INRA-310) TaxID=761204 RepID=W2Q3R3_PHYN3|nr:hypothetical protein PPTG_23085 [Phytophthora nicotianae INRA-310]ETN07818.1 hypothetical protein PPTG_23085 [Phytophthora nicotianae INRA-310]
MEQHILGIDVLQVVSQFILDFYLDVNDLGIKGHLNVNELYPKAPATAHQRDEAMKKDQVKNSNN